jgi:hypothetical protein
MGRYGSHMDAATPSRTQKRKRKPTDPRTTLQCSGVLLRRITRAANDARARNKPQFLEAMFSLWEKASPEARASEMKAAEDAWFARRGS